MTLTRERMRQDIAKTVGLPPEEIADEDSLVDLGLDSMRLMALVVKWEEIEPSLDFARLWEGGSLGAWWQDVEARRAEG